jgi:hypothetical protein
MAGWPERTPALAPVLKRYTEQVESVIEWATQRSEVSKP